MTVAVQNTPIATTSTPPKVKPGFVFVMGASDTRKLDELALKRFGIPGAVLMENAARALAGETLELVRARRSPDDRGVPSVLVLCGPGNNGGDGFAAARHLHNAGVRVSLLLTAPLSKLKGDAALNCSIAQKMGLAMNVVVGDDPAPALQAALAACMGRPTVVIDALLGTGTTGPLNDVMAKLVNAANSVREQGTPIVAADIPTGLDADKGVPTGPVCIRADVTVTFAALKVGFLEAGVRAYSGRVVVADIGAPASLAMELGEQVAMPAHLK